MTVDDLFANKFNYYLNYSVYEINFQFTKFLIKNTLRIF